MSARTGKAGKASVSEKGPQAPGKTPDGILNEPSDDRLLVGYVVGFDQKGQPRFQIIGQGTPLMNGIVLRGLHQFAGEEVEAVTDSRLANERTLLRQMAVLLTRLGKGLSEEAPSNEE